MISFSILILALGCRRTLAMTFGHDLRPCFEFEEGYTNLNHGYSGPACSCSVMGGKRQSLLGITRIFFDRQRFFCRSYGSCPKAVLVEQDKVRRQTEANPDRFFRYEVYDAVDAARGVIAAQVPTENEQRPNVVCYLLVRDSAAGSGVVTAAAAASDAADAATDAAQIGAQMEDVVIIDNASEGMNAILKSLAQPSTAVHGDERERGEERRGRGRGRERESSLCHSGALQIALLASSSRHTFTDSRARARLPWPPKVLYLDLAYFMVAETLRFLRDTADVALIEVPLPSSAFERISSLAQAAPVYFFITRNVLKRLVPEDTSFENAKCRYISFLLFLFGGCWLHDYKVATESLFPVMDEDSFEDGLVALVTDALEGAAANGTEVSLCSFSHITSMPSLVLPVQRLAEAVRPPTTPLPYFCPPLLASTQLKELAAPLFAPSWPLGVLSPTSHPPQCRAADALVALDGAHALGNVPLGDVAALGGDVYVSNGHKWFFTPKGAAFLWVAPTLQASATPTSPHTGLI